MNEAMGTTTRVRRATLSGVATICVLTLVLLLAAGSPALAAAGPERPNILLVVSDDLTACLGCYGNSVCRTPNLDRLASEGVRFDQAYCQYPVCGPSRASFMSGLYPNRTKLLRNAKTIGSYRVLNPELANHPSIGGLLRRNGYFSARVSKIFHMGVPGGIEAGEPGGDDPDSWDRAFNVMAPETRSPGVLELLSPKREHYGSNFARVIVPDEFEATQADHMAATLAVAILENRSKAAPDEPFFLAVGFVRPHVPLVAPRRLFAQYPESEIKLPEVPEGDLDDVPEPAGRMENMGRYGMNELQQRQAIAGYYASVSFMDEQVGRLLATLERLDLRKNTIIVFTSDHGYNLGEHHCWQKLSLFEESARVPLLISAPGFERTAGQASGQIVELIDLYPTLAELAGLAEKAPSILQGVSLRPLLEKPGRDDWAKELAYTISYGGEGESIRTPRWRYNRWGSEGEELYDHERDPHEFTNLARDEAHTESLRMLRKKLQAVRESSRGPGS